MNFEPGAKHMTATTRIVSVIAATFAFALVAMPIITQAARIVA
jgi:hypothetical protein